MPPARNYLASLTLGQRPRRAALTHLVPRRAIRVGFGRTHHRILNAREEVDPQVSNRIRVRYRVE